LSSSSSIGDVRAIVGSRTKPSAKIHDRGQNEVAISEQRLVEEMNLAGQDVHEIEVETERRGTRLRPDLGRIEPLHALAAVEHHLQSDDAERKCRQAEEIEGRCLSGPLLRKQKAHGQKYKPSNWQTDIEH
jgi:hypothetical protein